MQIRVDKEEDQRVWFKSKTFGTLIEMSDEEYKEWNTICELWEKYQARIAKKVYRAWCKR